MHNAYVDSGVAYMIEYADRDWLQSRIMQTAGRNPRKLDDALRLSLNSKVY
jgi:hypothetical protein